MKRLTPHFTEKDFLKFSELCATLPQLLELIPDDQEDAGVQEINSTPLCNYDFRQKKEVTIDKVDDSGKVIKPIPYQQFKDLYKFGTFFYVVTDGIAGQTQLNEFLFAQPNPRKPFEKKTLALLNTSLARNIIDSHAIPYLIACLENTSPFGLKPNPIILVLGRQHDDGNHENLEIYLSYYATLERKTGNISQYKMNDNAKQYGINPSMAIFHANMHGFQDQHLDSPDLEKIYDIYRLAIESHRPLIIHCKDGMDRTGAVSLALHYLHHWDRIFVGENLLVIANNIKAEHEAMQQLRGPGFCVASKSLLHGAVQLAFIFKAIQLSRAICDEDSDLKTLLNNKNYIQQIYILEHLKSDGRVLSPNAEKLLSILRNRAELESAYFDEFALQIPHPAITLWNIDKIFTSNITLGNDQQELNFLARFNRIRNQYAVSDTPDESFAIELDNLYFEIKSQSILIKIQDALKLSSKNQSLPLNDETDNKMKTILRSNESNPIKLGKLTGILLKLEFLPRFQQIEKMLFEVNMPEKDREIKRSEFAHTKKTIDVHLRSIESYGVDKRKLMKAYMAKLDILEKTLEIPVKKDASTPTRRRRFLSNPPALKAFTSLLASSDDLPKPDRKSSKAKDASPNLSLKPLAKSGPSSPRKSFFSKFETSPKLSHSSAKTPETSSPPDTLSKLSTDSGDTAPTLSRSSAKTTEPLSTSDTSSKLFTESGDTAPTLSRSSAKTTTSSSTSMSPSNTSTTADDTSSKLCRSSANTTEALATSTVTSKSPSLFSSSPVIPIRPRNRLTLQQIIGSDDGKSPVMTETTKPKTPPSLDVFKQSHPSPNTSSSIIEEKSEDGYFI